jgi:hypothetical protein
LVSVLVLLCQGLIFENEEEAQERATFGFGVTSVVILTGALSFSVLNATRRIFYRNSRELLFSNLTLSALQNQVKLEVLQIYSQEQAGQSGNITFSTEYLGRLAPGQRVEILGIVQKQFECDNEEFEHHVSQVQIKCAGLDEMRTLGVSGLQSQNVKDSRVPYLRGYQASGSAAPPSGTMGASVSMRQSNNSQRSC